MGEREGSNKLYYITAQYSPTLNNQALHKERSLIVAFEQNSRTFPSIFTLTTQHYEAAL